MDIINNNSTYNNSDHTGYAFEAYLSDTFVFWYYLLPSLISIPSYLILFTYILKKKTERDALHNHSILIVLFIAFCLVTFDYTWYLDTVRHNGNPRIQNSVLCQIWWLLDYGFYSACTVVLAWASFERHILIFHADLVRTKHKRILVHYLPLLCLLIYLIVFYFYIIFFPPCENQYDFTAMICGGYPCFMDVPYLLQWNAIGHGIVSTLLIAFFNVTLLIRVLWQKRHRRQDWKKCRHMAFQLMSVSVLFLSLNSPMMLISLVQTISNPFWGASLLGYLFFFSTLIHYILPLICLASHPNLYRKLRLCFRCSYRQVIPKNSIATVNPSVH